MVLHFPVLHFQSRPWTSCRRHKRGLNLLAFDASRRPNANARISPDVSFAPSAPAEAATNKKMLAVDDSGGTETDGDNVQ